MKCLRCDDREVNDSSLVCFPCLEDIGKSEALCEWFKTTPEEVEEMINKSDDYHDFRILANIRKFDEALNRIRLHKFMKDW